MARKQLVQYYRYQCTITGAKFKTTRQAPKTDELVSVRAYYELNPNKDDRPEAIKREVAAMQIELDEETLENPEEGEDSKE